MAVGIPPHNQYANHPPIALPFGKLNQTKPMIPRIVLSNVLTRIGFRAVSSLRASLQRVTRLLPLITASFLLIAVKASALPVVYEYDANNYYTNHNIPPWTMAWVTGTDGQQRLQVTSGTGSAYYGYVVTTGTALQTL